MKSHKGYLANLNNKKMIKQITPKIRIKTAPLNWIVEISKKNSYFNNFSQVRNRLLAKGSSHEEKERFSLKLNSMIKELGLENADNLSAWYLTNIVKHPEFIQTISDSSLKNLKPRKNLSRKYRDNAR